MHSLPPVDRLNPKDPTSHPHPTRDACTDRNTESSSSRRRRIQDAKGLARRASRAPVVLDWECDCECTTVLVFAFARLAAQHRSVSETTERADSPSESKRAPASNETRSGAHPTGVHVNPPTGETSSPSPSHEANSISTPGISPIHGAFPLPADMMDSTVSGNSRLVNAAQTSCPLGGRALTRVPTTLRIWSNSRVVFRFFTTHTS